MTEYLFLDPQQHPHAVAIKALADGRYQLMIGETAYAVSLIQADKNYLLLEIDGKRHHVHLGKSGNTYHIAYQGQSITLNKSTRNAPANQPHDPHASLNATMPGKVLAVEVQDGDTVHAGQTLVILEAMKMETRIKAPHDGVITAVRCAVGETVERDQTLIEMEES